MPGPGRTVLRPFSHEEIAALESSTTRLGLDLAAIQGVLGESAVDVYLNENVFWAGVPMKVWWYYIGGYQVIKKWLSYRDARVTGQSLTIDEARWPTAVARRLTALLLLGPRVDANYRAAAATFAGWPPNARADEAVAGG